MVKISKGREEVDERREKVIREMLRVASDLRSLFTNLAYEMRHDDRLRLWQMADEISSFALHLEEDTERAKKRIR